MIVFGGLNRALCHATLDPHGLHRSGYGQFIALMDEASCMLGGFAFEVSCVLSHWVARALMSLDTVDSGTKAPWEAVLQHCLH